MVRFIVILIFILAIRLSLFYTITPHEQIIRKDPIRETTVFSEIKQNISLVYSSILPKEQADLLMGIVFGSKDLDKSSKEKFIATGVMHVVAASGMNVTMLTSFVLGSLVLFLRRQYAIIATAVILLFYTALADFQPSIIRASIMGLFALGAGLYGRQNTALLALFFAAFLMIFWDPTIFTSISFILSFSATLGIILLDPILSRSIMDKPVFEDFRTTISAQIATTPILLFFFGNYSPISIIVNLLILWTIPPLMVLGGMSAVLSFISPILAAPLIYVSYPLLGYFDMVIDIFSKLATPWEINNIPWAIVVGYYLILFAVILWLQNLKGTEKQRNKVHKVYKRTVSI